MAQLKTQPNDLSVKDFINNIPDDQKKEDCKRLLRMMQDITGKKPVMWGNSIVGFGSYHYKYQSGREGDWFLTGFSPRKQNLTLYIMDGFKGYDQLMAKLGKHSTGVSCLYLKKLDDADPKVLEKLIVQSVSHIKTRYK